MTKKSLHQYKLANSIFFMNKTGKVQSREIRIGKFAKTEPIYKPRDVKFNGSELSNLIPKNQYATNKIYINPDVTKRGQEILSEKLHNEIEKEDELTKAFLSRERHQKKDPSNDNAKIFNDFCVDFIEKSDTTRDGVTGSIDQVQERLNRLEEMRAHLEEVERRAYRFEMNLPERSDSEEDSDFTIRSAQK